MPFHQGKIQGIGKAPTEGIMDTSTIDNASDSTSLSNPKKWHK